MCPKTRDVCCTAVSLSLPRFLPCIDLIPISRLTTRFVVVIGVIVVQGDNRGGRGERYDPYEERRGSSKRGGRGKSKGGAGGFDLTGTITNGNKSELFPVPCICLYVMNVSALSVCDDVRRNFGARHGRRPPCWRDCRQNERKQLETVVGTPTSWCWNSLGVSASSCDFGWGGGRSKSLVFAMAMIIRILVTCLCCQTLKYPVHVFLIFQTRLCLSCSIVPDTALNGAST